MRRKAVIQSINLGAIWRKVEETADGASLSFFNDAVLVLFWVATALGVETFLSLAVCDTGRTLLTAIIWHVDKTHFILKTINIHMIDMIIISFITHKYNGSSTYYFINKL
jgi:hypothetical protein